MTKEDDALQSAIIDQLNAELGAQGMSIAALAGKLHRPYDSTRNYLKKERTMSLGIFVEICGVLGVDADEVINRARRRLP